MAHRAAFWGPGAGAVKETKDMTNIIIFLMMWVLLFSGCFHFRAIRTDIAPTAKVTEKYPTRMALYFSPQLEQLTKVTKPETSIGGRHTYNYIMGPSIQAALIQSVQSAYSNYTVVNVLPRMREYERIISFDLRSSKVEVEFIPGYLDQDAKSTAEIYVTMEIIDGGSLRTLKKLPVHGKGASIRDASGFNAYAPMHFTLAMEEAIKQLAEITSNLLFSGVAELKVGAPGLPRQE
jgi:hypothetical protein